MRTVVLLTAGALALWPGAASAGTLYGTVRLAQSAATGITVVIACPGFSGQQTATARAVTDAQGSFSLRVQTTGRCEMRAQRDGRMGTAFHVFVSSDAQRFDFEIDAAMNRVR